MNKILATIILGFMLVSAIPVLADVSIDSTGNYIWVSSSNYNVSVTNNTAFTYYGMIEEFKSLKYSATDIVSGAYIANYIRVGYIQGASLYLSQIAEKVTPDKCYIDEDGIYRATVRCEYDGTIKNTWHLYDEYYVGRLTASGYTNKYNEALFPSFIVEDNNATAPGYDRGGLHYVYGSKLGQTDSTTSGTTGNYDTFDDDSLWWTSWYGSSSGDLSIGMIGMPRYPGSTSFYSYQADFEPTGGDDIRHCFYLDGTNIINNRDFMWTISFLDSQTSQSFVQDKYLVYGNPATVSGTTDITYDGFNNASFIYEFSLSEADANSYFNMTGNSNWENTEEKIYVIVYNTTNDKSLMYRNSGGWNKLLDSSEIQWEANGSYYNAIFYINKPRDSTTIYQFGYPDLDGDGWDERYDCDDNNATLRPIANNTINYISSDISVCPGTYMKPVLIPTASDIYLDGNNVWLLGNDTDDYYAIHLNNSANNIEIMNFNIHSYTTGIKKDNGYNVTIHDNYIDGNSTGAYLSGGYSGIYNNNLAGDINHIYNNEIFGTSDRGIENYGSNGFTNITNNEIYDLRRGSFNYGIYLQSNYNTTLLIENNYIHDVWRGIYLNAGNDVEIINNNIETITETGIIMNGLGLRHKIISNDIINATTGIYNTFTTEFLNMTDNTITEVNFGIRNEGDKNTISGNYIEVYYGVNTYGVRTSSNSQGAIITDNEVYDAETGYLIESEYPSNVVLNNNYADNTDFAYLIKDGYPIEMNNNIDENTIYQSIYLYNSYLNITNHSGNGERFDLENTWDIELIRSTSTPSILPLGVEGIGHFLNISNTTSWGGHTNITKWYYDAGDITPSIVESTLKVWRYNGTDYEAMPDTGVNTIDKYVWANNVSEFSIFGILGLTADAPVITIHSPESKTYYATSVPLEVTSNKAIDAWWYSLDGGATNITFTPNATLSSLSNGANTITVYGNDTITGIVGMASLTFTMNLTSICTTFPIMQTIPYLLILLVVALSLIGISSGNIDLSKGNDVVKFVIILGITIFISFSVSGFICG